MSFLDFSQKGSAVHRPDGHFVASSIADEDIFRLEQPRRESLCADNLADVNHLLLVKLSMVDDQFVIVGEDVGGVESVNTATIASPKTTRPPLGVHSSHSAAAADKTGGSSDNGEV